MAGRTMPPDKFEREREVMIESQLRRRGIDSELVLDAMQQVPRELFVPKAIQDRAYADEALAIGLRQTISQPYMVALMTQALEIGPQDVVLEIGTGSGYQTAVLSKLCRWVYSVELLEALSERAASHLRALDIENVTLMTGDGTLGFKREGPFEGILVTAGAPRIPEQLRNQLAVGGRLVVPVGDRKQQVLYQIERTTDQFIHNRLGSCIFVPLLGQEGWQEGEL